MTMLFAVGLIGFGMVSALSPSRLPWLCARYAIPAVRACTLLATASLLHISWLGREHSRHTNLLGGEWLQCENSLTCPCLQSADR